MVLCSRGVVTLRRTLWSSHMITGVARWCLSLSDWCPVVRSTLLLTFNWSVGPAGDSHGAMVVVVVTGGGAVTALSSPLLDRGRGLGWAPAWGPSVTSQPALSSQLSRGWPDQGRAMQRSDCDLGRATPRNTFYQDYCQNTSGHQLSSQV